MKKVVFITGSSSGIGLETALKFHKEGYQVVATMRKPATRQTPLHQMKDVEILHLDVLDEASMTQAVQATIDKFGQIDVLVNNAGYDLVGPVELLTEAQIKRQLDTNVVGLISMTNKVLPFMRAKRSGTIINIASIGGILTFPLFSIYHATKFAVVGFSESLLFETAPFNIKVRVIEPGPIKTNFYTTSYEMIGTDKAPADYKQMITNTEKISLQAGLAGSLPDVVAHTIFKAATATGKRFHYATGKNAKLYLALHRYLPLSWYVALVKKVYGIG